MERVTNRIQNRKKIQATEVATDTVCKCIVSPQGEMHKCHHLRLFSFQWPINRILSGKELLFVPICNNIQALHCFSFWKACILFRGESLGNPGQECMLKQTLDLGSKRRTNSQSVPMDVRETTDNQPTAGHANAAGWLDQADNTISNIWSSQPACQASKKSKLILKSGDGSILNCIPFWDFSCQPNTK